MTLVGRSLGGTKADNERNQTQDIMPSSAY